MAPPTLSKIFSHIHTIAIIFSTLLFIEIIILIRSFTRTVYRTKNRLITPTQYLKFIEQKIPTISYKKNNNNNNRMRKQPSSSSSSSESSSSSARECAVCLSDFEDGEKVRNLKCKHTFHKDCLDKWLQQYLATCPLCRTKVLPDEVVAKYQQQLQNYDDSDEEMAFMFSVLHGTSVHRFF